MWKCKLRSNVALDEVGLTRGVAVLWCEEEFTPTGSAPTRPSMQPDPFAIVRHSAPCRSGGVRTARRTARNCQEQRRKAPSATKV
jgi:hypothetical protein